MLKAYRTLPDEKGKMFAWHYARTVLKMAAYWDSKISVEELLSAFHYLKEQCKTSRQMRMYKKLYKI